MYVAFLCFMNIQLIIGEDTTSTPGINSIDFIVNAGPVLYKSNFGLSFGIDGTINTDDNFFRARYNHQEAFSLFDSPTETVNDLGLITGVQIHKRIWYFDSGIGASAVFGIKQGRLLESGWFTSVYETIPYATLGIPFEMTGMIKGKYAGCGISFKGNINSERSYIGLFLLAKITIPTK